MSTGAESIRWSGVILVLIGAAWGCASNKSEAPLDVEQQQSLLLLMPQRVSIVEPFTTWADLDDTPGVDGVNVYVQPTSSGGDPIQATGSMYVELYRFLPASGDNKGERLALWSFQLSSQNDQDARWRRALQMYEFPVLLPDAVRSAGPAEQYVLSVTHDPPLGDRHADEVRLQVPLAAEAFVGRK